MTTAVRAKRRILVATDARSNPLRGPVDVRTEGRTLTVTLDLPTFLLAELQWEVNTDSLVVRSTHPGLLHVPIVLKGPLVPGRFVVIVNGTIFEVRMERTES